MASPAPQNKPSSLSFAQTSPSPRDNSDSRLSRRENSGSFPDEEDINGDTFSSSADSPSFSFGDPSDDAPPSSRKGTTWLQYVASITPLICGGLGPTITLMALSGCADKWRDEEIGDRTIDEKDPKWVVATTSLAICIGFIANVLLLARMMGRGNPKYMQYGSIVLWVIECVYVQIVGDAGAWSYAQGFWMTVCSAALSSICALLMAFNSFFLPPFGKRGKMGLSGPQRVFVIQIMLFVTWLAVGAAIFYATEGFTFSESVYFVDVTVTTVGFGDSVVPNTNLGRALVMPYAIIGIISLGLVITSIRTIVVERAHIRKKLVEIMVRRQQRKLRALKRRVQRRHASVIGVSLMIMGQSAQDIHSKSMEPYSQVVTREELRQQKLKKAEKYEEWYSVGFSLLAFLIFWFAGAAIFSSTEGWSYFDGLYFCMIFFLTIGYGDFVVTSNAGRAIYIVYSLLTIPIMTILISLMSDTFLAKFQKSAEKFGVKGGEDERYKRSVAQAKAHASKVKTFTRKLFTRKKSTSTSSVDQEQKPSTSSESPSLQPAREENLENGFERDLENGKGKEEEECIANQALEEEVLSEVESIRQSVDKEVDQEMKLDKTSSRRMTQVEKELMGNDDEASTASNTARRRKTMKREVEKAVKEFEDDGDQNEL